MYKYRNGFSDAAPHWLSICRAQAVLQYWRVADTVSESLAPS